MENVVYPAVFHKEGEGYWVEFPDLPGCLTEGATFEEAFLMAGDALDCYLSDSEHPIPTPMGEVRAEEGAIIQAVRPAPYLSEEAKRCALEETIENGLACRNLTRNQAARILAVDRSYISHIASGKKTPSPEMAKRIGLLLGFDWRIFYE